MTLRQIPQNGAGMKVTVDLDPAQAGALEKAARDWGVTPGQLLAILAGLVRVDTSLADEGLGGPVLTLDAGAPLGEPW
ncbi:hypothetical protein ACFY4B_27160 [Kitasatospora sp. NPDC001261]|uniref:hypothetical protein n=1 Tax=Kitasatospora sp. NPDC001261 TaxID=3364012 RepID=UPI00369DD23E